MTQPQSPIWAALSAVIPWGEAKVITYVLNQQGHQLVRAGFIQVQKRPRRPEFDINLLAPALDTPSGHPAIWEKLLSHVIQEAARHRIERIYVDVPDQPLPVSSFAHVGFTLYSRQTIWRLSPRSQIDLAGQPADGRLRLAVDQDEWALQQLYAAVTPMPIQQAECGQGPNAARPPLLYDPGYGICRRFVLEAGTDLVGCLQVMQGRQGVWLRIWADTLQPDGRYLRALLRAGLAQARSESRRLPVFVGVNDYHGGLSSILDELGFAPYTDRAKMVKQVLSWVKEGIPVKIPSMEPVGEVITTPFVQQHRAPAEEISRHPRRAVPG